MDYTRAYLDLAWGEHGIEQNELVYQHFNYLDQIVGLGAIREWVDKLISSEGEQADPHAHILAAVVARRLEK